MLLRLKVRNFLSFYDEVSFDMFPNPKRTSFPNHIYKDYKVHLLKQAAIYGANGSGKSNLLEAVKFIKDFVTNKEALKGVHIPNKKFRLIRNIVEPISFFIEFYYKKFYFSYKLTIDDDKILEEELHLSGVGQEENELIYSRKENQIHTPKNINANVLKALRNVINSNPMSSLLSINNEFPILDNRVKIVYEWFNNCLKLKSLHSYNSSLITLLEQNLKLSKFTCNLIDHLGLGIEDIGIGEIKLNDLMSDNEQIFKQLIDKRIKEDGHYTSTHFDKILFRIEEKNGERIVKKLFFQQLGIDGFKGNLGFESQSDGTAKILNLNPILFDLIHNECVYFIDEIENSIHPLLIFELIKYYSNTPTKGQLIFTTHQTELLNQQELMRPDEIWFTEKQDGQTELYSLNDFKEHNTINIKNGYMDGRYGGIPFINDLNEIQEADQDVSER